MLKKCMDASEVNGVELACFLDLYSVSNITTGVENPAEIAKFNRELTLKLLNIIHSFDYLSLASVFSYFVILIEFYSFPDFYNNILKKKEILLKSAIIHGINTCEKESSVIPLILIPLSGILSELLKNISLLEEKSLKQKLIDKILELTYHKYQDYKLRTDPGDSENPKHAVEIYEFETEMYNELSKLLDS
jgi:hypothetical protein